MALATLHWRMLAPVALVDQSIGGIMNAIYQMGTATTYADGSTRTPGTFASPGTASLPASLGTGSAWTWNYDNTTYSTGGPSGVKTACYAYAPTTTAINQAIIVCGAASITSPTAVWKQLYADTRLAGNFYAGIAKNSATYTSWNNATTPFSSGDFTGLAGVFTSSVPNLNYLLMWESEEAVIIQGVSYAYGVQTVILGAYIDPLSANTANAETDGRLYGLASVGFGAWQPTTWLGSAANGTLLINSVGSQENHSVTFTPGAGTITATARFGTYTPASTFLSRNGDIPQLPYQLWTGTQYVGQLRQMNVIRDGLSGEALQAGATVKGYIMGASGTTSTDALLLVY